MYFVDAFRFPLVRLTFLKNFENNNQVAGQHIPVLEVSNRIDHFAVQIPTIKRARVRPISGSRNADLVKNLDAELILCYDQSANILKDFHAATFNHDLFDFSE